MEGGMMAQAARLNLRMQKELKLLGTDPPPGVFLPMLSGDGDSSLSNIEAQIEGPEGTVYAKGIFNIKIQIPERYPFQPPNVTFATPIYHPNIDNGGRICLDILNLPPKGAWQPSLNISTVLTSIGLLLSEPNPDDGLMCEASREYKYNRQAFDQKARSWTERYANATVAGHSSNGGGAPSSSDTIDVVGVDSGSNLEEKFSEHGGIPKKLCRISRKLSLESSASPKSETSDNKENAAPTRRLSLSLSQKGVFTGSSKSGPFSLSDHDEKQPCQDCNGKTAEHNIEQQERDSPEIIIVSDSEGSEEEGNGPMKSSLLLVRKRLAGKWKANACK